MAREKRSTPPAVGGTSLLVVFAVLSLTVFALLSLTTVQADVRIADASARAVANYYAADSKAQEVLACLRTGAPAPEDVEVSESIVHYDSDQGGYVETVYSFSCPITDNQDLEVEVRVDGADYEVLRWQAVSAADWEADDILDLWDGTPF